MKSSANSGNFQQKTNAAGAQLYEGNLMGDYLSSGHYANNAILKHAVGDIRVGGHLKNDEGSQVSDCSHDLNSPGDCESDLNENENDVLDIWSSLSQRSLTNIEEGGMWGKPNESLRSLDHYFSPAGVFGSSTEDDLDSMLQEIRLHHEMQPLRKVFEPIPSEIVDTVSRTSNGSSVMTSPVSQMSMSFDENMADTNGFFPLSVIAGPSDISVDMKK